MRADVFVQPDLRRKRVVVDLADDVEHATLHIEGADCRAEGSGRVAIAFPGFTHWSPADPVCYQLQGSLTHRDGASEEIRVPFAMREFRVKDNQFCLNDRPILLRGVAYHVRACHGGDSAAAEHIRSDLTYAKHAGFNLIRLGTDSVSDESIANAVFDVAAELGLLVWAGGRETYLDAAAGEASKNYPHVDSALVRSYRNAIALVLWVSDEGDALRSVDPSRLIACFTGDQSRERNVQLFLPYSDKTASADFVRAHIQPPVNRDEFSFLRDLGSSKHPLILHEFGWTAANDASMSQATAVSDVLTPILANAQLNGYCYGALRDTPPDSGADGHNAGLLDHDGKPKPSYDPFCRIQTPLQPVIHIENRNLLVRESSPVFVTVVNEARLDERVELSLQVVGPTNQVLWKKKRHPKIPKSGKELWSGEIAASGGKGPHRFVVRLMRQGQRLAESAADFHVFEPVTRPGKEVYVLDPERRWQHLEAVAPLANELTATCVVPPLGNTIRNYPADLLAEILGIVHSGGAALMVQPPPDWNDIAAPVPDIPTATPIPVFWGHHHLARLHPVFDGLPTQGAMGAPYRNVVPPFAFEESSEQEIAGCTPGTGRELATVLVRRFGVGRLMFTHMPLLAHSDADPVAARLLTNMITHLARRAVLGGEPMPQHQRLVDWMRKERVEKIRRWRVIGPFPNWNVEGHDTVYPPEESLDWNATHFGWRGDVMWRDWCSMTGSDHVLDLAGAFSPPHFAYDSDDYATAYAYAEFLSDVRQPIRMIFDTTHALKVWLNGREVYTEANGPRHVVEATARQDRNHLLVKVTKSPGPFQFKLRVERADGADPTIAWWR